MAAAVQTSDLFKTLGARIADAHNAAKDVAVGTVGGQGLPPNINNGIAKLAVLEFIEGKKEEDKGKFYFRAAGVMRKPEYQDGIKVAGRHTSQLIPFFDTPKRQNKKTFLPDSNGKGHYVDFRDLFAHLGVAPPPPIQPGESKEAFSARITSYYAGAVQILLDPTKPPVYFEVRTWQPDKVPGQREPGVFEFWGNRCEYTETGAAANPVAAVATPGANGQPVTTPPAASPVTPPSAPVVGAGAATAVDTVSDDLDALAEAADADPTKETDDGKFAVERLSAICSEVGVTNEQAATVPDWAGVVGLIRAAQGGGESATGGVNPVKGATVTYDGKACEVTSVNGDARTVTLKGPDGKAVVGGDKKLLKVSFDLLS